MPTIAVFRFWYEGNSFSPLPARRADFQSREWFTGDEAARFYRGKALEPGGAIAEAEQSPEIELVFLDCAAAYPGGPIEAGLVEDCTEGLVKRLTGRKWDGVYASLHGAAVSESLEQPDLWILRQVRAAINDIPMAVSFDLHANLNPEIGRLAEIVVGYKTHPHVDMAETGAKALRLLARRAAGEIAPQSLILPADFVPTSFNMRTDGQGPMTAMAQLATETAEREGLLDITVFGGFACADSPDTGASISLCGERDPTALSEIAQALRGNYRARASDFEEPLPEPGPILQSLLAEPGDGPVAVLEPSDNVFSGGAGDTPGLLRALLDAKPEMPCVFAFFWDPDLVREAAALGEGTAFACQLGARLSDAFGPPVRLHATVERLVSGGFTNEGPMEAGLEVDPGEAVVLRSGKVRILVTSRNVPVNDPAYFSHFGLPPEPGTLFCVKAKNHFRAAFAKHFDRFLPVETPGPAPSDLLSLPFQRVPPTRLMFGRTAQSNHDAYDLREAEPGDAEAIAGLHAKSWRSVYRGILSDDYLDGDIEADRLRFWTAFLPRKHDGDLVLIAEDSEGLQGFIAITDEEEGYDAVIENLHVEPQTRGGGLGRRLIAEAARRLKASGARSACLWVFDGNAAALAFYQRLGGVIDKKFSDPDAPPSEIDSRVGWHDLDALIAACETKGERRSP